MYVLREIATVGVAVSSIVFLLLCRGRKIAWQRPLIVVFAAFAAYTAFDLVRLALDEVRHPPLWDFKCFWMYGRVVAAHRNAYDSASYQMYRAILNPGNDVEFNTIGVDVGLPYPPPAALLVYPIGLIANLSTAMIVWYAGLFAALAGCIYLLWRRFFAAQGGPGLTIVSVLVLGLAATRMNIGLGQLDFVALLLLLLFWGERTPWRAGLWLAPLICLRPLFVLLAIYLIVRRQWSALGTLAATSATLIALCVPVLGFDSLTTYFLHNPTLRYPVHYFAGASSLYKLLTSLHINDGSFSLATHPVYDVAAVLCVAAAAGICAIRAQHQREICLAFLVVVGLWVYPTTSAHYCVLLLPPMCAVWRYRKHLALSSTAVVGFFAVNYLLVNIRGGAHTTGLAIALDCIVFGWLAFRQPTPAGTFERHPRREPSLAAR